MQSGGVTTYVYGLALISTTGSGGNTSYYLPDGLGDTVRLTDINGAVTDSYTYDAFGALRSQTGSTANDFRFTGQQNDYNANRGLYYLRARHYDPALGRFLQEDPLPLLQGYPYVANNATNLIDPAGLFPPCPGCGKLKKIGNQAVNAATQIASDTLSAATTVLDTAASVAERTWAAADWMLQAVVFPGECFKLAAGTLVIGSMTLVVTGAHFAAAAVIAEAAPPVAGLLIVEGSTVGVAGSGATAAFAYSTYRVCGGNVNKAEASSSSQTTVGK